MCAKYKEEQHIKYCLANALIKLMQSSPFEQITVNEICYTAHVGRATFYHYADGKQGKDDLLLFKLERDYDQYTARRRKMGLSKIDEGGDTFNFIYDNKECFSLLHRDQRSNVLIQFLLYAECGLNAEGDQAYLDYYLALGYLGLMQKWYQDNYSKTALEVASILFNKHAELVRWHIKRYLEIQQT